MMPDIDLEIINSVLDVYQKILVPLTLGDQSRCLLPAPYARA
jgi:hypothetical protein